VGVSVGAGIFFGVFPAQRAANLDRLSPYVQIEGGNHALVRACADSSAGALGESRSMLTMLGLIIGVSATILVLALGVGTQKFLVDLFKNFGTNVVVIGEQQGQRTFQLTLNDVEALSSQSSAIKEPLPRSAKCTGSLAVTTPAVAFRSYT